MRIFEDKGGSLTEIPDPGFKYEKDLHSVVDHNLDQIFPGLERVQSKFPVEGREIDTLAYDHDNDTFVIIEYKKEKGMEIANQVSVYKALVDDHRAECVLALRDNLNLQLKKNDIKWKNTRMIFVKPDFSKQEIEVLSRKSMAELCAVRQYPGGLVVHHLGSKSKRLARSLKSKSAGHRRLPPTGVRRQPESGQETKHYSEQDWLDGKYGGPHTSQPTRRLYFDLKDEILSTFRDIKHEQKQEYAKFHLDNKPVCNVHRKKNELQIYYHADSLSRTGFVEDVRRLKPSGGGYYRSTLQSESDIQKALECVEETYRQKRV